MVEWKTKALEGGQMIENGKHFFYAEDTGKPLLPFGFEIGEDVPFALEYMNKEELDSAVGDAKGSRGPFTDISTVKEIVLHLRLCNLLRGLPIVVNEDAHGSGIAFLRALAHSGKLKGSDGLLEIIFHGNSPCNSVGSMETQRIGELP